MAANEAMVDLWNSEATSSWVRHAERYDGMLAELGALALAGAALGPGARVLDVGCGAGALSLAAAQAVGGGGRVVGVDISAPMLAFARRRVEAAGVAAAVDFVEADAQVADLPGAPFDAVVSRFGVMFFADPVAAFANLLGATAAGGRLSFVAWQGLLENEWSSVPAGAVIPHVGMPEVPPPGAPGPFGFADGERVRSILTDAGWADVAVDDVHLSVPVAGGVGLDEVVAFYVDDVFGRMLLGRADDATQAVARAALRDALAARAGDDGRVTLGAAVWLVTAVRAGG